MAILAGMATPAVAAPVPLSLDAPGTPAVVKVFDNRIQSTNDLPTLELRRLRRRMQDGDRLSFQEMRSLADAGDGLAAFRYGQWLVEMDDPEVLPAAALYFASAAYTDRDYAVRPLIEILERGDLGMSDKRLDHLENALRAFAIRGNPHASAALARFYEKGSPFGRHPDRAQSLLVEMAEAGDHEAAMTLVTKTMSGKADLPEQRLRGLLGQVVENAETLGRKSVAKTLLRRLDNGPPETATTAGGTDAADATGVQRREDGGSTGIFAAGSEDG
ncbi:hypothetical protein Salmuc_00820 [Salipiger mucosus DSM 16094]|uniref:Uncharacterized protein n=2 Tax=Salipiger mucosus TaxID=263378 RepID=S9SI43_9RHOB|nr:hypothetical protein Salmuc_00820 [Salipiger mucosus DSM 16094]